ncbi:cation:proton antiporter regulatory subunit [Streptomyces sp. NPDC050164]|uniref:cation:proton antiporter regulatory subunit n=1 Tax=Streptomyces sp. NPDC050164 TaxID=3365605 RepID=UPI00379CB08A
MAAPQRQRPAPGQSGMDAENPGDGCGQQRGAHRGGPECSAGSGVAFCVLISHPAGRSQVRPKHGVTVVGMKRPGVDFTYATPDKAVQEGDVIVATGKTHALETFAELS